jgi:hypothetical protein
MPEQDIMTTTRRTALAPFLLDLLDFMEEKIREAMADEASQVGAISEAAGALPLLRYRLREDDVTKAQFVLIFYDYLYEPHVTEWWAIFARMDRATFEKQAAALVGSDGIFPVLRVMAAGPGIS